MVLARDRSRSPRVRVVARIRHPMSPARRITRVRRRLPNAHAEPHAAAPGGDHRPTAWSLRHERRPSQPTVRGEFRFPPTSGAGRLFLRLRRPRVRRLCGRSSVREGGIPHPGGLGAGAARVAGRADPIRRAVVATGKGWCPQPAKHQGSGSATRLSLGTSHRCARQYCPWTRTCPRSTPRAGALRSNGAGWGHEGRRTGRGAAVRRHGDHRGRECAPGRGPGGAEPRCGRTGCGRQRGGASACDRPARRRWRWRVHRGRRACPLCVRRSPRTTGTGTTSRSSRAAWRSRPAPPVVSPWPSWPPSTPVTESRWPAPGTRPTATL